MYQRNSESAVKAAASNRFGASNLTDNQPTGEDPRSLRYTAIDQKSLLDIVKSYPADQPYRCDTCGMQLNSQASLLTHLSEHVKGSAFTCDKNGEDQNRDVTGVAAGHITYHAEPAEYLESQLSTGGGDVPGSTPRSLSTADAPAACAAVPVSTSSLGEVLPLPQRTVVAQPARLLPCQCPVAGCGWTCRLGTEMAQHVRLHAEDRPFRCGICQRAYHRRARLAAHMRTHTGERPFRCPVCSMAFGDESNLARHVRNKAHRHP
ncbi:uncharacterized protein LOC144108811 isoform X2 [Amblyomma americanum]